MNDETDRKHIPAFEVTVPLDLYEKVVRCCGGTFADSYLYGAVVKFDKILPRTQIAFERLNERESVKAVLISEGLTMIKPPPFTGTPAWQELGLPEKPKLAGAKGNR
jgi:hypothetical protein